MTKKTAFSSMNVIYSDACAHREWKALSPCAVDTVRHCSPAEAYGSLSPIMRRSVEGLVAALAQARPKQVLEISDYGVLICTES